MASFHFYAACLHEGVRVNRVSSLTFPSVSVTVSSTVPESFGEPGISAFGADEQAVNQGQRSLTAGVGELVCHADNDRKKKKGDPFPDLLLFYDMRAFSCGWRYSPKGLLHTSQTETCRRF